MKCMATTETSIGACHQPEGPGNIPVRLAVVTTPHPHTIAQHAKSCTEKDGRLRKKKDWRAFEQAKEDVYLKCSESQLDTPA